MKRRHALLVGLALTLSLAGSFALWWQAPAGQAMAAVLRDPLSVMGQRSPGARAAGALAQTKPRLAAVPPLGADMPGAPSERVLPTLRYRPETPVAIPDFAFPDLFAEPLPAAVAYTPGAEAALPILASSPVIGGVPVVFPGVPVGGGGGGGITPTPAPTPVTPPTGVTPEVPVTPVPEPATWVSMILGLGLVGSALRRRHRGVPVRAQRA